MAPDMHPALFSSIREVIIKAKTLAYKSTNAFLLNMYWEIGRLIINDEQAGQVKAAYGKSMLKNLSSQLTLEFGAGFDERNLNNMRAFYLAFPIWNAVRTELSWTHYRILSRISKGKLREQYLHYAIKNNWGTRSLQRNIKTQYVDRVLNPTPSKKPKAQHLIKDSYIFEFLGMSTQTKHTENKIEAALINHLQQFMMELGKGFAFVARQQHMVTDTADFFY